MPLSILSNLTLDYQELNIVEMLVMLWLRKYKHDAMSVNDIWSIGFPIISLYCKALDIPLYSATAFPLTSLLNCSNMSLKHELPMFNAFPSTTLKFSEIERLPSIATFPELSSLDSSLSFSPDI